MSHESWAHPVAKLHVPQPVGVLMYNLMALRFADLLPGLGNWLLVLWAHLQELSWSHTEEADSRLSLPSSSFPFLVCFWSMPPPNPQQGKIAPNLSVKHALATKFWQAVSTQERNLSLSVTCLELSMVIALQSPKARSFLVAQPEASLLPQLCCSRIYCSWTLSDSTFWFLPIPLNSSHTALSPRESLNLRVPWPSNYLYGIILTQTITCGSLSDQGIPC